MTRRLARSHLFVPGDNPARIAKAMAAGADAVIIDLEDAVAPARKADARRLTADALAEARPAPAPLVAVRLNAVDTGLWADDLDAVVGPTLDVVRVAKVESAAQLAEVAARLDALEQARGLPPGGIGLVPTLESALGVLRAEAIAAVPRVWGFAFGATDFLRDIGAPPDAGDRALLHAQSHLVLVSRAAALQPPIASVHPQIHDLDGLRRTSQEARSLGFFGRSCIHPRQLPVVHEVFSPSAAELAAARAIVEAWRAAAARSTGAVALPDGQFLDRAVALRAEGLLALADSLSSSHAMETRP